MDTCHFRWAVIVLTLVVSPLGVQGIEEVIPGRNKTSKATLEANVDLSHPTTEVAILTTDLSMVTTEDDWSPFPPGDILNNPFLRRIRFCTTFCFEEEKLQGLRNAWPYVYSFSTETQDGETYHISRILQKAKEIAVNPKLRAKLYCFLFAYPLYGNHSLLCQPGNHTLFLNLWKRTPLGMLRDNIPLSVFNATLAFLSLMLGIFGNILIIFAILTKKELKSSTNVILLGMAGADCLNSVTVVFHAYIQTFLYRITNPVLGPYGCATVSALKEFSQLAATNHLITLSFERYFAICWPMKTSLKFTRKKTILMLIVNWLIAAVQLIPHVLLKLHLDGLHYADYICLGKIGGQWYIVYNLSIYLILPVPILCFNYICVVRSLLTSIKRSRQMTGDSSAQTSAEKARLKLTCMLITLVVIYIITVTPGRIFQALYSLRIIYYQNRWMYKVTGSFDLLRAVNSCTNVVVYAIISRQFRTAFKEILCHCWRKAPATNSGSGNPHGIEEAPAGTMELNQV